MSGVKGRPSTKLSVKGMPSVSVPEYQTLQPQDAGMRAGMDVHARFAFRVNDAVTPRTAQAGTGNPSDGGPCVVNDTSTPARVGDFVRFVTGNAAQLELPIISVSTNQFVLPCPVDAALAPASGDTFFIMRFATQLVDNQGNQQVNVVSGPVQYNRNAVATTVAEDTVTPANTKPLPVQAFDSAGNKAIGDTNETAPATDIAASGLNGRLQRIAQRLTSLIALLPASLGQKTMANSLAVVVASDQSSIPVHSGSIITSGSANALNTDCIAQMDVSAYKQMSLQISGTFVADYQFQGSNDGVTWFGAVGQVTNIADAAGLNGSSVPALFNIPVQFRYFRVRLITYTSGTVDAVLVSGFLGEKNVNYVRQAGSFIVEDGGLSLTVDGTVNLGTLGGAATEAKQDAEAILIGAVTEAAPATDIASSGLNGRLQRIAQRITSMIALLPSSLGQKTMANSLAVVLSSDQSSIPTVPGLTPVDKARNDYTSTNVTTAAYTQLIASTAAAAKAIEIFDSSGQTLLLAIGGAGSEVDKIYIVPGGNGRIPMNIPASSRISIKAVSATASTGEIDINLYG